MINLEKVIRKIKQHLVGLELKKYADIKPFFFDKTGIEIGGPSRIFQSDNILPVYSDVNRVDGVNFSNLTIWENKIDEGLTYDYNGTQKGRQFIAEASNLIAIDDNAYDFLLSSHSLEHCANVIKTMLEWKRVVRSKGVMIVVLPDRRFTFDHQRSVTAFEHLLDDFQKDVSEDDLTHLQEIIDKHDLDRDPGAPNKKEFIERSLHNIDNRCLHHHVFDIDLLVHLFEYLDMNVLFTDLQPPFHVIVVAQKT